MQDAELFEAVSKSDLSEATKSVLTQRFQFLRTVEQELPVARAERVRESELLDQTCKLFAEFIERAGAAHGSGQCSEEECSCWQANFRKVAFQR